MRLLSLALTLIVLVTCVSPAQAQTPWFAAVFYDRDLFAGSSPVWTDWETLRTVAVRQFDRGALAVEAERTERFDFADEALAIDGYLNLWSGAYGNLRVRAGSQSQVTPRSDWRLEVFQSLAGGWEVAGSAWHMNVPGPNVFVGGVGVGRYVSAWYLRARANLAEISGTRVGGAALSARRFFMDDGRQFIEGAAGFGGEAVTVGPGPLLDVRDTWFAQVTVQRTFREPFGFHVGLGVHDFERIPARRRVTLGLTARF